MFDKKEAGEWNSYRKKCKYGMECYEIMDDEHSKKFDHVCYRKKKAKV